MLCCKSVGKVFKTTADELLVDPNILRTRSCLKDDLDTVYTFILRPVLGFQAVQKEHLARIRSTSTVTMRWRMVRGTSTGGISSGLTRMITDVGLRH